MCENDNIQSMYTHIKVSQPRSWRDDENDLKKKGTEESPP